MIIVLVLIFSLFGPFFLLPLEQFLPWPHIFEELFKLIVVVFLVRAENQNKKNYFIYLILAAAIFSTSESILYLMNFFLLWNIDNLFSRLILTSLLHLTTSIIIYFGVKSGKGRTLFALLFAIVIHYLYNTKIAVFF
ncbi:MAG: PrsW family glutamic-type intramembrane protease [Patescibacteria group bacterium]